MKIVAGDVLTQRMPPGARSSATPLKIPIPVAAAVVAAHSPGVLPPRPEAGNVLVAPSGVVRVFDTSVSRATNRQRRISAAPALAPEQVDGDVVDYGSDIFSFGALLYELLTGRRVIVRASLLETLMAGPEGLADIPADWPTTIAAVVRRCLQKDPARRCQIIAGVKMERPEVFEDDDRGGTAQALAKAAPGQW